MPAFTQERKSKLVLAAQALLMVLAVLAPGLDSGFRFWEGAAIQWIGGLIGAPGWLLLWVSILSLGDAFTVQAQPKEGGGLVRRWPYTWVRNPIYTGILMAYAGWALWHESVLAMGATVGLLAILRIKVSYEEAYLTEKFGDEYREYCRRVGRFFPGLRGLRE